MSIRKLEEGKYVIDYYPLGRKGKRERIIFRGSEADSRILEMELRRQHAGINSSSLPNPKINDILPEYMEWLQLHRKPLTVASYKQCLKSILPIFGNIQFSRITPSLITKYKLSRPNKRPGTINTELSLLQSIISYAIKNEYARTLPFKIEKIPNHRPMPLIPSPSDIEKMLENINVKSRNHEMKKILVLFLAECGLRWHEASNIKWENIDWEGKTVLLTTTKGGKPRNTYLTPRIYQSLFPFKKEKGWVFESDLNTNKPYTSLSQLLRNACKRAKIKHIYPHLLRHAFATYSLAATSDMKAVQRLLGHSNIGTTEFYAQISIEHLKKAHEKTTDYISQLKNLQQ